VARIAVVNPKPTRSTMHRKLSIVGFTLALIAAAALLAGGAGAAGQTSRATIKVRTVSLGKILVDSRGRTLYLFEKDKHDKSACYGQCAKFWPPVLTSGKAAAGTGAKASLLGTTKRRNGTEQVTYAGHPLYRFLEDKRPGQTKGEGTKFFGAEWYVLAPNGKKIDKS
jgi:predicted lipoprotein with Yx(FWY)xxD motif